MRRLVLALALSVMVAAAQTEVRHAIVLPSYKDLKYPPLPPLKVPDPTEITLSNGMKVLLLEDHELPLISGAALIRTGNLFDPPNKKGLAGITGEVLRSGGTKTRTGDELDKDLENVAASIESQIGESNGTLSFSCLKDNADQVLALFRDLMTTPEFREDKVDLAKTQSRSEISRRNDDPDGIAAREFSDIVYGRNTPYGWMIEYADIDNIQRQDLIDFYRRYYFPANITLEILGDFSTADMQAKLEQLFGAWKYTQPAVPAFPKVEEKARPGIYLATKDDTTQTFFHVGELGGELRDKDYPALEVASEILGGGFSSRLFRNVRTQHGWAYNINSSWAANFDHPGTFDISGSTQSAHTVDTLKAIDNELEKIRTTEVTDEELQTAKDTVLNGFIFNFDRPSKTLNRLMIYQYYGYPKDFIFQYQKAIAAVTKADVMRVAQEHFQPKNLSYVAVGNPKEFGTPLASLGIDVHPIDLTIPEPKQQAAKATPESLAQGKALLAKAQQAMGGAEKLAAVKDLQFHAQLEVYTPGATMKVKQTMSYIEPSTIRQDNELPFLKQSVYSDGKTGWLSGMQGVQSLSPPVLKQIQGESFRELVGLVLSDRDAGRTVNLAGVGVLDISNKEGESVKLTIDEKTGLPAKLGYQQSPAEGGTAVEEIFSDWRDADGLKLPFQWAVMQGDKKFAGLTVKDYKVNSGLTAETLGVRPTPQAPPFARPPGAPPAQPAPPTPPKQ
ncbi:MAG TPA: pitrilysin family protein [Bryobacteraceae bacterium]|nr:pitrilysin family protein [Bryobacteraceae bacterium]